MSSKTTSMKKSVVPAIVYKVECLSSQHIVCKTLKNTNTTDNEDIENIPLHVQKKIENLIREKYLNSNRFKNPIISFEQDYRPLNNSHFKEDQSDSSDSMANHSEPKITRYLKRHRSGGGCSDNYSAISNVNSYPTALRCVYKRTSSNTFRFDKRDDYDTENCSKACCSNKCKGRCKCTETDFDTTNLYAFQRTHDEVQTDDVTTKDFGQNTHRSKESVAKPKTRNVCCGTSVSRVCKGIQANPDELKNQNCNSQFGKKEKSNMSQKEVSEQQLDACSKDDFDEISGKIEFIRDNEKDMRRFSYSSVTKKYSNTGVKKHVNHRKTNQSQYGGADEPPKNIQNKHSHNLSCHSENEQHLIDDNEFHMGRLNHPVSELPEEHKTDEEKNVNFGEDTYFIRLKRRGHEYTNKLDNETSSEIFELQIPVSKSNKCCSNSKNCSKCSKRNIRITGGKQRISNKSVANTYSTSSSKSSQSESTSKEHLWNIHNREKTYFLKQKRLTKSINKSFYNYRRKYTSTDSCS